MNCSECGQPLPDNAAFCSACGRRVAPKRIEPVLDPRRAKETPVVPPRRARGAWSSSSPVPDARPYTTQGRRRSPRGLSTARRVGSAACSPSRFTFRGARPGGFAQSRSERIVSATGPRPTTSQPARRRAAVSASRPPRSLRQLRSGAGRRVLDSDRRAQTLERLERRAVLIRPLVSRSDDAARAMCS